MKGSDRWEMKEEEIICNRGQDFFLHHHKPILILADTPKGTDRE